MIRSLFSRMLLSHLTVIVVSTVILGGSLSYLIRSHIISSKPAELITKGSSIVALISDDVTAGKLPSKEMIDRYNELTGARVWLADKEGTILSGQPPRRWSRYFDDEDDELVALFDGHVQSWVRTDQRDPERALVVALPIRSAPNPTAIFLYAPITGVNRGAQVIEVLLGYSLLVGLGVSIVLGYFMSRSLTQPIADIGQAASRFAKGDFKSRTNVTGDHELGRLGEVFNSMADSLAQTEQNRRDFLANVTHEIKTPIAAIQAMTEALIDGVAGPEQEKRYLGTIVAQTVHMNGLVQDLLDLAQLEAGELKVEQTVFGLNQQLAGAIERYLPLLAEKAIQLDFRQSISEVTVLADPLRVDQVINNLLSNAVRHSAPKSCITVKIERIGEYAHILVADQGEGIKPDDLPHIWERFYRAEKSRSRRGGGSGLGLAITRRLVLAMGGDINVESTVGKGTAFTFSLPVAK